MNSKVKDKCRSIAEDIIYIYTNAKILYQVWDNIPFERRQESINTISRKVKGISEITKEDRQILNTNLKELAEIKPESDKLLAGILKDNLLDAAIKSISECECGK